MKLFLLLAFAVAGIPGAAAQALVTNLLSIPGRPSLEVAAPTDWVLVTRGQQSGRIRVPRTAELTSKDASKLVITAFWDGFTTADQELTAAAFEPSLKDTLEAQYVPISVERKAFIAKFTGKSVQGWFARFTDAKWVAKTPPAGEYANIATGWFRCGDVWGYFTLYTNEKDGPRVKQGLAVMRSLSRTPAKAQL